MKIKFEPQNHSDKWTLANSTFCSKQHIPFKLSYL